MKIEFFDIHSHLNFGDYGKDLEKVIDNLKKTKTHTIVVGTDFETSKSAVELADKHEGIYACIGVHPVDNPSRTFEKEKFEELVKHPKVVAVGECGLDFYHQDRVADYDRQKKLFLDQVHFAIDHDKPLMIHSRDAYLELLTLLEPLEREYGDKLWGNVHFFAGNLDIAKRFWALGFSTSFTGVITFVRDYDEVIAAAPLTRIMSETDAPFVAPVPYRGKRNEPSYVSEVVKKIAEIRNEDFEYVRGALVDNALRMIG